MSHEDEWGELFDEVTHRVRDEHPATFCQVSLDLDGPGGELWLTAPATEDVRRQLDRLDPPVRLVEDAPYSEAEMVQLMYDVGAALDAVEPDDISSVGSYSVETDTVEVSIGGPGTVGLSATRLAASITRELSRRRPSRSSVPRVVVELSEGDVATPAVLEPPS